VSGREGRSGWRRPAANGPAASCGSPPRDATPRWKRASAAGERVAQTLAAWSRLRTVGWFEDKVGVRPSDGPQVDRVRGGAQRRHRRIVPPPSREARTRPSGENATAETGWSWPTRVQRSRPVAGSHSLTVPSAPAEASVVP